MGNMKSIRIIGGAVALLLLRAPAATAQSLTPHAAAETTETTRRQAQQVDEALTRASPAAPVLSGSEASPHATLVFPAESPCFAISRLEWKNAEAFAWLVRAVQVQDVCIGSEGITRLRDHLRYLLIERGYVTTQVLIGQQDLRAGKLEIELLPGRIGSIAETGDAPGRRQMAMPMAEGDVLNLRDLDQTLENIRTVAGDASVRMVLEPGKEFGQTDLAIHHAPEVRRWRAIVTADNSGIDATGKNQLGGVLVVDSPWDCTTSSSPPTTMTRTSATVASDRARWACNGRCRMAMAPSGWVRTSMTSCRRSPPAPATCPTRAARARSRWVPATWLTVPAP